MTTEHLTHTALVADAASRAAAYLDEVPRRRVTPSASAIDNLSQLGGPLPDGPTSPEQVLALIDRVGSPATVASAGGRYFGFVTGGALPASVAASIVAAAWDQNVSLPYDRGKGAGS